MKRISFEFQLRFKRKPNICKKESSEGQKRKTVQKKRLKPQKNRKFIGELLAENQDQDYQNNNTDLQLQITNVRSLYYSLTVTLDG